MTDLLKLRHFSTAIFSETKSVTPIFFSIFGVSTLSTNSRGEMRKISPLEDFGANVLKASKLGEGKREGLPGVLRYKGTKENIVGNKKHEGTLDRKIKPLQIFFDGAVDGGKRWQRNMLHREQIRKNCGNVRAQGNFGREQGNKDHPRIPSKAVILDK